ncbi:hypothetical protein GCM10023169_41440 [Georgenia halophila]|uniref:DUF998 domain-containing protein n=1 Tax=Georgenia halophila TaxID=620889 RepID=A0ABP8LQW2_9MICO
MAEASDARESDAREQERSVPWRGPLAVLAAVSLILVAVSWVSLELVAHPFFEVGGGGHAYLNVGVEGNVPTWWTIVMFVGGALGFVFVGVLYRSLGQASGLSWWFVGALLLLLCLDEDTGLHERLHEPARLLASPQDVPFVWLILGVPLALAVIITVIAAARRIARQTRTLLLAGLGLFFVGAVGLEGVGSQLHATGLGESSWLVAAYHAEELFEMLGVAVMAVAPLRAVRIWRLDRSLVLRVRST